MTARQQHVLDNLERVTHDRARVERRYELDGVNVSVSVRSLLAKGSVAVDDAGRLVRSMPSGRAASVATEQTLNQIRAVLSSDPKAQRLPIGKDRPI